MSTPPPGPNTITREIAIDLPPHHWRILDSLADASGYGRDDTQRATTLLVRDILDHIVQGVSRPGSWERDVSNALFGPDAVNAAQDNSGHIASAAPQTLAPTCEICGQPADSFVVDAHRSETHDGNFKYSPAGQPHVFCPVHNRPSRTIDIPPLS